MAHFLAGEIARISIFTRGLTAAEVMSWTIDTRPASLPLFVFDGWRRNRTSYATQGGSTSPVWAAKLFGWTSVSGSTARDVSSAEDTWSFVSATECYLVMPASTSARFTFYDSIRGVGLSQVTALRFVLNTASVSESTKVCIKLGGAWWMCDQPFARQAGGSVRADGTVSQPRELLTSRMSAVRWCPLTLVRGSVMSVGSPRYITFTDVTVEGVGFHTSGTTRPLRVGGLTLS